MQQVKAMLLMQRSKALNQLLLQAIELVTARRKIARVKLVFQLDLLEECRFIQRGRRIVIVLLPLDVTLAISRQIKE